MEQQSQARERQREQPQDRRAEENRRTPERERLSDAGLAARAVLAGESLLDLPPSKLEELAGWMGNQGMNAWIEAQAPPLTEVRPPPLTAELDSAAFPVPDGPLDEAQPPVGLTAREPATAPADPYALGAAGPAAEGGGPDVFGV